MKFRRLNGTDTWHWCTNCSNWPTANFDEKNQAQRPSGDACNQCKSKTDRGECRSS